MAKRVSRRAKPKEDGEDDYQTSLSLLYGKPGVPEIEPLLALPPPEPKMNLQKHKVIAVQDPAGSLEYTQLYLNVYIVGPYLDTYLFPQMFVRTGSTLAKSIDEADVVVFSGGADVDPTLYGLSENEWSKNIVHCDPKRDAEEMKIYLECLEKGVPMLGICRGAQFLAVMNGAKLYLDCNKHNAPHAIYDHQKKINIAKASSAHHQMVRADPEGGMEVIATASASDVRMVSKQETRTGHHADIEAFFYPETLCLGIQGHPEYSGYPEYTKWCMELVEECFLLNTATDWVKKDGDKYAHRRLKPELLDQRSYHFADILPPSITMSVEIH